MEKGKYNLERFKKAQEADYELALEEIKNGKKETHWMWYIFPQLADLGYSCMSQYYGIEDIEEARAYVKDPVLGPRLKEISRAFLSLRTNDAEAVLGEIDALKFLSSMTLFEEADPEEVVFSMILEKYFGGQRDQLTSMILEERK
ncbi:MAG: DUF1810 domain-containing protein [Bacteroidaceae bacterium]|nr:DUF1810 domain-containing protein [Bacteroidaceae bacterium]